MSVYMKVPFASGSVTATGFEGWIELQGIRFHVEKDLSMETGSLSAMGSSLPKFDFFTVFKKLEDSSGGILQEATMGMTERRVEIAIVEAGDSPKEYARYILDGAFVQSFTFEVSGTDMVEQVLFAYSKIEAKYTPHDTANTGASKIATIYNLK